MLKKWLWGLMLLLLLEQTITFAEGSRISPGWDWSFPYEVRPVPYSGFVTWGKVRFSPLITVAGVTVSWKNCNPAPDLFNWKPVWEAIERNRQLGLRTGIHLKGVEERYFPEWVIKKYRVPGVKVQPLQENQPWRMTIYPPWLPDVQREYLKFLSEFSKTGIPQMDDVVYGYIHGVGPSRGEELFLRPQDAAQWEREAGLTPERYFDCIKSRLDAMLAAFKGVEYKLAWMSIGDSITAVPGYKEKTAGLWKYALEHGTGWRGGAIDFQHTMFESPVVGSRINEDGYCVVDDSNVTITGHRFRGEENEEYGKNWEWRFGSAIGHEYRHRISTLRSLQLRLNFIYVSPETLKLNPDLNEYAFRTMGRTPEDSPDAWAYLRECAIRQDGKTVDVKNLERWLVQRDVSGCRSVPCERVDRYPLSKDPKERHFDYDALRTDLSRKQNGLAFQLDSRFWNKPQPAVIKITLIDNTKTRWWLEYYDASGKCRQTGKIVNTGDGQRKTATLEITNLDVSRKFPGDMDFRIITDGPGDLAVTLVRVIKSNWEESD